MIIGLWPQNQEHVLHTFLFLMDHSRCWLYIHLIDGPIVVVCNCNNQSNGLNPRQKCKYFFKVYAFSLQKSFAPNLALCLITWPLGFVLTLNTFIIFKIPVDPNTFKWLTFGLIPNQDSLRVIFIVFFIGRLLNKYVEMVISSPYNSLDKCLPFSMLLTMFMIDLFFLSVIPFCRGV